MRGLMHGVVPGWRSLRLFVLLPLALAAVVVSGCASKPQLLPVTPNPVVRGDTARGAGRSIAIEVVDARGTKLVGLRDPAHTDSVITTPAEMLRNVSEALESGFRQLGFNIVPLGDDADIALEVRLVELGYVRDPRGVVRTLSTGVRFEVTSVMRSKSVDAIYADSTDKETVLPPSPAANADIINGHIDRALAKLLADARLTTE